MKQFLYLSLCMLMSVSLFSCDDSDEVVENSGVVDGIWAYSGISASVETSSSLSSVVNPIFAQVLQTYAVNQEASYYYFNEGEFESYIEGTEEEIVLMDSGSYSINGDVLTLISSDGSSYSYDIITANETTLRIRKDYSESYMLWGANLLSEYTGITINAASVTVTYYIGE